MSDDKAREEKVDAPAGAARVAGDAPVAVPLLSGPPEGHRITVRSLAAGFVLAIMLCTMNSYLTLSFGVIEEGPTIAALFFFAVFFISKLPITTTEMVIVSTMGSAGGSLGFIANFYAAKAMTAAPSGAPYTLWEMVAFAVVTSMVGLVMVIPLRQLLVLRENLPWPGSKATAGVIRALVEEGDPKQAKILLVFTIAMIVVVVGNKEDGFGLWPAETAIPGMAAFAGIAVSWSPFSIGGSYLMGFRTCVGFLAGAIALMIMSKYHIVPAEYVDSPHKFFWPGLGFLVSAGLVNIALNWRAFAGALKSIGSLSTKTEDDDDPIMTGQRMVVFAAVTFLGCIVIMNRVFGVPILLVIVLIGIGGFLQNVIATRAAALTAFNPARVMGILLQGVTSAFGGRSVDVNLTGAGFVAGSGAQAGVLTGDLAYGRWFRVPSRWQFWAQTATVVPCALVSAFVFQQMQKTRPFTLDSKMPAPVAKMWAASARIFDGTKPLPAGALKFLLIGAIIGALYVLIERVEKLERWLPESTGVGLGLVLSASTGFTFFLGGFLMWIVLARWGKMKDVTLTTIAVACIVGEGIGGVMKPLLALAGLIKT